MPDATGLPHNRTYWDETAASSTFPQLSGDIEADVTHGPATQPLGSRITG